MEKFLVPDQNVKEELTKMKVTVFIFYIKGNGFRNIQLGHFLFLIVL